MGICNSKLQLITLGDVYKYQYHICGCKKMNLSPTHGIYSNDEREIDSGKITDESTQLIADKNQLEKNSFVNMSNQHLFRVNFITISNLRHMTSLYLSHNDLGALPEAIGSLVNLRLLDVTCTKLSSIPQSTKKLVKLRTLKIGNNNFVEMPDTIGMLPRLKKLFVDNNQLQSISPRLAQKLSKLLYLDLSRNPLKTLPVELFRSSALCVETRGCGLKSTVHNKDLQPLSLVEICARSISQQPKVKDDIPELVVNYLLKKEACSFCSTPIFGDYATRVRFVKRERTMIPIEYILCSPIVEWSAILFKC